MRVRATLFCGWCDREVEAASGEVVEATGHLRISLAPPVRRLVRGCFVCPHCGGPLFLRDWQTAYEHPPLDPAAFARGRPGRRRPSAA